MDIRTNLFNLFSSEERSATNPSFERPIPSGPIFRSESSSAPYQSLLSWNRSRPSPLFARSTSSSSRPVFGQSHQSSHTPSIYNPNRSLTTPGSHVSEADRSSVIVCIVEGRGRAKGTIGMAAIDLYHPILQLSQFTDSANYESLMIKIQDLNPIRVLLPKTFFEEESNHLIETIECFLFYNNLRNARIQDFDRKYFKEDEGIELIKRLRCDDNQTLLIELKDMYYCLATCAALLKYIETYEHLIYAPKSLRIVFKGSVNTMSIDPKTAKLLELIINLDNPKSGHTLFETINKTKTRVGYRMLRSNILQPSTDHKMIQNRLDMVEEIISSESLFTNFETILSHFTGIEIERVICNIVQTYKLEEKSVKSAERKIETVILLKHIITLVEPLVEILDQCQNANFKEIAELLNDPRFQMTINLINEIINDSCNYVKGGLNMTLEKCHAIKEGVNSLLDIARETYSESIDDIHHIVERYSDTYEIPMKVSHNPGRGYHIEIKCKEKKTFFQLEKPFIKAHLLKNSIVCTTWELINKNNRINSSIEEIYLMSDAIINTLIENIRQYIGCLYDLSEALARIDVVFSLASQCAIGSYVRPEFGEYTAIKSGRHPVLERVLNRPPVPNDTFFAEENNFHIITGPNMSGKTILLKQVALLQVMAQIGSYIPAEFAKFRICDKLFSRIGNNDEIETSSSTFMVEMREISYILHNMTDRSMIIIDELGRGTSAEEGVGLCFSICERLLKSKAFTLFVTHFLELTKLDNYFLNVSNFAFGLEKNAIEDEMNGLHGFTHVLEPGVTNEPFYGIRLAKSTSMDQEIVNKADAMAKRLRRMENEPIFSGKMSQKKRLLYKLTSILATFARDGTIYNKTTLSELQLCFRDQLVQTLVTDAETESSLEMSSELVF